LRTREQQGGEVLLPEEAADELAVSPGRGNDENEKFIDCRCHSVALGFAVDVEPWRLLALP
jgi:hypothetical protein